MTLVSVDVLEEVLAVFLHFVVNIDVPLFPLELASDFALCVFSDHIVVLYPIPTPLLLRILHPLIKVDHLILLLLLKLLSLHLPLSLLPLQTFLGLVVVQQL